MTEEELRLKIALLLPYEKEVIDKIMDLVDDYHSLAVSDAYNEGYWAGRDFENFH